MRRYIKIIITTLLFSLFMHFTAFSSELYMNPLYYSDSVHVNIQNTSNSLFYVFVYNSSTQELVSVVEVFSNEKVRINIPGNKYYDFVIHSKDSDKRWENHFVKSGSTHYIKRR